MNEPVDRIAQVTRVIELIESGKSENAACAEIGINRNTFRSAAFRALAADKYARALEALAQDQAEKLEECVEAMRNGDIDHNVARVEIDARKWFASKFLPRRYGERTHLEHSGNISSAPIDELTDAQLLARIEQLSAPGDKAVNE